MSAELQELLALVIVALVAGLYWYRRRRRSAGSCGDCAGSSAKVTETPLRFYRRRPGAPDPPSNSP